jgi:hypothetical protein
MPAFMPALSVSGVMSAGFRAFGAAPAIESESTLPLFWSYTVMKPLPPMPFISGSAIACIAPTAAAASKAFPPFSSICRPADEPMGCPAATRPWRPVTAGRVNRAAADAGASAACCCARPTPRARTRQPRHRMDAAVLMVHLAPTAYSTYRTCRTRLRSRLTLRASAGKPAAPYAPVSTVRRSRHHPGGREP